MKAVVFNLALLLGVAMVGVGIGLQFSIAYGLLASGLLVVALTLIVARMVGVRTGRKDDDVAVR